MPSVLRAAFSAAALVAALATGSVAKANGRFPAASMLVAKPGDSTHLALRATYGLLFSNDSGATWDWVCEGAVGYSGNEDPSLVIAGTGAIVVGTFDGIVRSVDGGCHWSHEAAAGSPTSVIDLASRPGAPDQLYAVTCQFAGEANEAGIAANRYRSQLFVSDDAGDKWTSRATLDPSLLIDSVEVAPSDAHRVYVSAIRTQGLVTSASLLESDDDGAHWTEHAVPFAVSDRGLYIAAVDPLRAGRVYLRTSGLEASRLFVSDDGGATLVEVTRGGWSGPLLGFALADDGATLFLGGPKDGLLRASTAKLSEGPFAQVSKSPAQCLTTVDAALWECAPMTAGYVLGVSTDHGTSFSSRLALGGMRGPLQCATPSAMDSCGPEWSALQSLVGRDAEIDAAASLMSKRPDAVPRAAFGGKQIGAFLVLVAMIALAFARAIRTIRAAKKRR